MPAGKFSWNFNYVHCQVLIVGCSALHIACSTSTCLLQPLLLLQVACRSDANSAAVSLLCTTGEASLVARTYQDGLSALHMAAMSGSLQCVQQLLAAGAPYMPRNRQYCTPYDVATQHGQNDVAAYLSKPGHSFGDYY